MKMNGLKHSALSLNLLHILKTEYPGAVDVMVISLSLRSLGYSLTDEELNQILQRLHEKDFLHFEHRHFEGLVISFAVLTASGWDFLVDDSPP